MLYSPDTEFAADLAPQTPPAPQAAPTTSPAGAPTIKPEGAEALTSIPTPAASRELFEAIRAEREAKDSRVRQEEAAQSALKRAEQAEARLSGLTRDKEDIILNTVEYLKGLGITDVKDQLLVAEAIMYTHVPDRAPPDHRAKVVEAQMKRDRLLNDRREADRVANAAKEAETQAQRQGQELERRYTEQVENTVKAAAPGTYPVSQAWFAEDHATYTRELISEARAMAEAAHAAGTRADLSPALVAKSLEARYAERVRRAVGTQAPQTQTPEQPRTAPLAETKTTPVPALPQAGGSPLSEQARIERAIRAAFAQP